MSTQRKKTQEIQSIKIAIMNKTLTRFFVIYFVLDLIFVLYFIFIDDYLSLLNSQIGALAAMSVAVGSFLGYKSSVNEQVKKLDGCEVEQRDIIDKIEDNYELFDDEEINYNEITEEEAKNIYKEERDKLKKSSKIKNIALTFKGIFSPFRLIGYFLLVLGFFWLEGNGHLKILPFILGLSILPVSSIILAFRK